MKRTYVGYVTEVDLADGSCATLVEPSLRKAMRWVRQAGNLLKSARVYGYLRNGTEKLVYMKKGEQ
jgi:hypothetical protein